MAYTTDNGSRLVANYFIEIGKRENVAIDPMKIQKLVYLGHGWHLAFFDTPLATQPVEAWRYGPVIPDLYQEFREFRAAPIDRPAKASGELVRQSQALLNSVWQAYKGFTAVQLSMLTHEPGGAWDLTIKENIGRSGSPIIPTELIAQEFKSKKKSQQSSAEQSQAQTP
jgi:uncharacterized phage-associated protein